MLRGHRIDNRRGAIACCLVAMALSRAAPAAAQDAACSAPQRPMQQIELMFGRGSGGRIVVGETAWSRFLAREITPRFPEGLTVLRADGQWRDKQRGRLVREPSRLVIFVVALADTSAPERIKAIIARFKQQFRQQSVAVISYPVCAAF